MKKIFYVSEGVDNKTFDDNNSRILEYILAYLQSANIQPTIDFDEGMEIIEPSVESYLMSSRKSIICLNMLLSFG